MDIPVTSTIGFLGLVLLAVGLFLFFAGLEIFKIKQVTVMPGKKTWVAGLILVIIGVAFLIPELRMSSQVSNVGTETPSPTATITETPPPPTATNTETPFPTATYTETPLSPTPTITETMQSPTIDVPDPLGDDVLEFAATVNFDNEPEGSIQNIGGIWESEWNRQGEPFFTGSATILIYSDNWITIVYQGDDGGQFLIKAKWVDNKLIGRYINLNSETDTTPWVGIIVDDNRIDGKWTGGEWNFIRNQ